MAEDIFADRYLPPTDRSIVDGYAVRAEDTSPAGEGRSVVLRLVGVSRLGEPCLVSLGRGQTVAVATGSEIPRGADAAVMVEETSTEGSQVTIRRSVVAGENISRKGEDISPNVRVLERGRRLRPEDLGILKALGRSKVKVAKKPRVGVISTGNELIDRPRRKSTEKVLDLNRPILSAMIKESGGEPIDFGIVRDDSALIEAVLKRAVRSCDAVVISAGSSAGKKDLVPDCIRALGNRGMLVHGVAMRPAMPTGLAIVRGKPVLSLPGFPVSAMIAFRVFGRPLITKLLGSEVRRQPTVQAVLKESVKGGSGFRAYVRVILRNTPDGLVAEPLKVQRSAVLMSIVAANGIMTIPEDARPLKAGQKVDVEVMGEIV